MGDDGECSSSARALVMMMEKAAEHFSCAIMSGPILDRLGGNGVAPQGEAQPPQRVNKGRGDKQTGRGANKGLRSNSNRSAEAVSSQSNPSPEELLDMQVVANLKAAQTRVAQYLQRANRQFGGHDLLAWTASAQSKRDDFGLFMKIVSLVMVFDVPSAEPPHMPQDILQKIMTKNYIKDQLEHQKRMMQEAEVCVPFLMCGVCVAVGPMPMLCRRPMNVWGQMKSVVAPSTHAPWSKLWIKRLSTSPMPS